MARLADMHLSFLENLLVQNPGVQLFTSYFFTDIPANSGGVAGQAYGNPSRSQVQNAFQAKADKAKYLGGTQLPVTYPDVSSQSLTNQLSVIPAAPAGTMSIVPSGSGSTKAAIATAANANTPEGVLAKPPAYKENVVTATDVVNSN
jgi:hypothetical protein